jgi:nitroreductase
MNVSTFQNRKSTRRYDDKPIEKEKLDQLVAYAEKLPFLQQQVPWQLCWINGKDWISDTLAQYWVSYGRLVAAPVMLCPYYPEGEATNLETGYALEHLILKATELGLGTLWFSAGEFEDQITAELLGHRNEAEKTKKSVLSLIKPLPQNLDEILKPFNLPNVILFGYPSEKRMDRIINNAIRMESAGNSRKQLDSLFLSKKANGLSKPVVDALSLALTAPSKRNQQPWRMRSTEQGLDVGFLHKRQIDAGIFVAHMKIAFEEKGVKFKMNFISERNNDIDWVIQIVLL